jgi:ATP-dependent HslUV protease subunit HslV
MNELHGTTILCVKKDGKVVIGGDGRVSMGNEIVKERTNKIRKIGKNVIVGFAGSTADAMTMFEVLANRIAQNPGRLDRICDSLGKYWRTRPYQKMEALMVVANPDTILTMTGNGDVITPDRPVVAIGSGSAYAVGAALALLDVDGFDAEAIVDKAMGIAGDKCVFTNKNIVKLMVSNEKPIKEENDPNPELVISKNLKDPEAV